MEPFLLADFVRPQPGARVLEVGTGCGIIPLLLLTRQLDLSITAVEIQESLARQAESNLMENGKTDRVRLVHADFVNWSRQNADAVFDWVVSNPPYRKRNSGRVNPDLEKAIARHELTLDLAGLVAAGARHLAPDGRMALCYPLERLDEVRRQMEREGLRPVELKRVAGHPESPARFFLILAQKTNAPVPLNETLFYIYEADGAYTSGMKSVYESFNYPGRSHRNRQK